MNKIIILSAGPGLPDVVNLHGHSSEWIPEILSNNKINFEIRKVYENDFGKHDEADAWIITGSKYSVYEDVGWIKDLEVFLRKIYNENKPVLGICFGHQLIAQSLGGIVKKNPLGWELGSYKISLSEEGKRNLLFKNIDDNEVFYESHQDVVSKLPEGAISLASTDKSNQSFQYNNNIFGVQFHPEFSWDITRLLMDIRMKKGIEVDSNTLLKSSCGHKILNNFFSILERR